VTLVLAGGGVVESLSPPRVIEADVAIEDDRVSAVGPRLTGGERRDCTGALILPGNVCAHTHAYSSLARGMPYPANLTSPSDFVQILQRVWWRLDRALDEESIRASAMVAAMEALESGTTTVIDHHASPNAIDGSLDVIADAFEQVGLRSVLCYEVTDRDGADRAHAGVEENRRFLETTGERRLTRGMMGAHASFTLSEKSLVACVEAAREADVGIHIHVAEDRADEADCVSRFGTPVVERMHGAGALTDRALLAHCVHVHPAEVALIRSTGAAVAHNARSNMNNSVGRAPAEALGDRVALGTDGIGSDMFAESQAAYWRAREENVHASPAWVLDRLAAGASLAGRMFGEPALGRIAEGAPADLAVLDYPRPAPMSADTLAGHWFFGLSARHVRDVLVGGDVVLADRRPTRVDRAKVADEARGAAERLWARLADVEPHPFEPAGAA
jgi:putative selenium metabolism protein SsnA